MSGFTVTRNIDVPAERIWAVLSDFTHPPVPAFTVKVEKNGTYETKGIGTIRVITIGKRQFRERLETVTPPNLTYSLLSGAPVKDYIGSINIKSIEGRTNIIWKVEFRPKIIGTTWIIKRLAKNTINRIISEMEAEYGDQNDSDLSH